MQNLKAVIIGASHAAAQLSVSLRQEGWEGDIVMIGDEPHFPIIDHPYPRHFYLVIKVFRICSSAPLHFIKSKKLNLCMVMCCR